MRIRFKLESKEDEHLVRLLIEDNKTKHILGGFTLNRTAWSKLLANGEVTVEYETE